MRKSISTKLFVITAVLLLIFISFTIYFQATFFENFYTNRKIRRLENNVLKFNTLYANGYLNRILGRSMKQFEEDNNAKIVIINKYGIINPIGNSEPQSDSSRIDTINKILRDWFYSPQTLEEIILSKKTYTAIYYNTDYNVNNIVCISPVISDEVSTDLILAVASLQPIEEAASVFKEFYIYIFLLAVVFIILLSFIYSNMISKPLIILNKAASQMADMDFSATCKVDTEDEIGSLAKTLNFLSFKLDTALKSLQDSNKQLQEDIKRERHLDTMRKEFIAGVSHELKTPISLISGYAEGIKDGIADGEAKDFYLDVIIDESEKMSALVSDMLDLSQLESGSFKLHPEAFNISRVFDAVLKKHSTFMGEKKLSVNTEYDLDIMVIGDKVRIEQVITNFITNALRHTSHNGVINISAKEKDENTVYFEIENSGHHIEPSDLKNIWDKFYKTDKSRIRSSGGTGLGLSIVKNILFHHHSVFGVKNTDIGVAFHFTLKKDKET
jgi:two-component system, OmpR family, sensor histidine kinase VanS